MANGDKYHMNILVKPPRIGSMNIRTCSFFVFEHLYRLKYLLRPYS